MMSINTPAILTDIKLLLKYYNQIQIQERWHVQREATLEMYDRRAELQRKTAYYWGWRKLGSCSPGGA